MKENRRPIILVVDDVDTNRIILCEILKNKYDILQAENGLEAISSLLAASIKPDLILMDVMMPIMDGFKAMELIMSNSQLKRIPVIFITAAEEEKKGLSAGAVDYIMKPFQPEIVRLRVSTHLELGQYRDHLEHLVEQKAAELITTKENFLETLANLIEYRNIESGQHVKRTKELSAIIVRQLLRDSAYAEELGAINNGLMVKAAALHDIGKIAIPDNILLKPGKLTSEEFAIVETHTSTGAQIIQSMIDYSPNDQYLGHCYDICLCHHERWDGKGYPGHLDGKSIPLSARVVSLVDVYDALVSERVYKKAFTHEEAVGIICESSGKQFDPVVISAFLGVHEEFRNYEAQ